MTGSIPFEHAAPSHRAGTSMMVAGTLVSVVSALVLQVIGGRALGVEAFAPVSVMWTLLFLGLTIFLFPIEQMVIRRLVLARGSAHPLAGAVPEIVVVLVGVTLAAMGFCYAAAGPLLGGDLSYVPVAAAMFIGHGVLSLGRGYLAGSHRFVAYGVVVSLDALAKLTGAVVVAVVGMGPVAFTWALAVSPVVVFLVRPFRSPTRPTDEGDEGMASERRFITGLLISTAASQTVLAAGPLVVGALGATSAAISVFFVTITLLRGPMSASYNLLARILPVMTARSAAGEDATLDRWARRLLVAGLGGSAAMGALAAAVGPAVVGLLYGAEYRPEGWLAGLAAAAVIAGMFGLGTSQILVGRGHTGRMAVVWVAAVALSAVTVAVAPGVPGFRVAMGFCVGEVVALIGLTAAATRR